MDDAPQAPPGQAEALQRAGPVPHQDNISIGEEHLAMLGVAQVQHGAPLSRPRVKVLLRQLRQRRWVNPQHSGPQRGERPARNRPSDHTSQVEHPDAVTRKATEGLPFTLGIGRMVVIERDQKLMATCSAESSTTGR